MRATFWWPKIIYGHAGLWAKGPNTINILHDYILPWQEWVRLSLANQPADAPLSSSITTPTSSRFLPWIILSPNHGGAFELSYYHQTMLISFLIIFAPSRLQSGHILSSSYHCPPPPEWPGQFSPFNPGINTYPQLILTPRTNVRGKCRQSMRLATFSPFHLCLPILLYSV